MKRLFLLFSIAFCTLAFVDFSSIPDSTNQILISPSESDPEWGFFGHRRINRMAVFTLPPEMIIFYKKHIEFITDHAVDPDKRRYATRHEAVRHYIDIDQWGEYPFDDLPRTWTDALLKYASLHVVNQRGDTLQMIDNESIDMNTSYLKLNKRFVRYFNLNELDSLSYRDYRGFFIENILPQYYEDQWPIAIENLNKLLGQPINGISAFAIDHFSEHGILPYHLERMQRNLTSAFLDKNAERILRLSTEFGHYIGDAYVPLHTTTNYNGQLTDQIGIHAFWESRIPELFADQEFDFFVGKAEYIEKPKDKFWDIILTSHSYVDSVLLIEKDLSKTFPEDQQYCFDDRMQSTIRTECRAYAAAYNKRLDGMVEARMRGSIQAIGSAWYTAWLDAGQPDLEDLLSENKKSKEDEELEDAFRKGETKGREH